MKKLKLIMISVLTLMSAQTLAASISVGPYTIDTDAMATDAVFSGTVFKNKADAITDIVDPATTYIKGQSVDAAVTLGFANIALSNQGGNDLALFFLTATNNVSVDLNGTNIAYASQQLFVNPDDPFTDIGEKYLVENVLLPSGSLGIFDLSVIFIDLNDFGIALEQSIGEITVNIGNGDSFMTIAAGLNAAVTPPAPIPVPAAVFLFLSGLAGLSLVGRRK